MQRLKKLMRWIGITALVLLFLLVLSAVLLLVPAVQTRVARVLAGTITERIGAEVRIGSISISPYGAIVLTGVHIADLQGDTLFDVADLRVRGIRLHPRARVLKISAVEVHDARFALAIDSGAMHSNLTEWIARIAPPDSGSTGADWTIRCTDFLFERVHFSFHDANVAQLPFGVDLKHVDIPDARIKGNGLKVVGDSIMAELRSLSFTERSGLVLEKLSGSTTVSGRGVAVNGMVLRTAYSDLHGELAMRTSSWADHNRFIEAVDLQLELDSSLLDFADIAWFAPDLEGIKLPVTLRGTFSGPIAELKGKGISLSFGERSVFQGNAELSGLPDVANTFMLVDIDRARTDQNDLSHLPIPPFTSGERMVLPAELKQLGTMGFSGRFTGFLRSFTAFGAASSAMGDLRMDLSYERDTIADKFRVSGRAATNSFNPGPLIGASAIGAVAADLRLKAEGRSLQTAKAELDGEFPLLTINGAPLTGITVKGHVERNLFSGELHAANEHLLLDFKGLADLRGRWPLVDFTADLRHADLKALKLIKAQGYHALSLEVRADGRLSPDSLQGKMEVTDISYCDPRGDHELGDALLMSDRQHGENVLRLDATFGKGEVVGDFLPTRLPAALAQVVYSIFPSLSDEVTYQLAEQRFSFSVETRDMKEVLDLVAPGLEIGPGATANGALDTRTFDLDLTAQVPRMKYGTFQMDSVHVIADKTMDILAFAVHSPRQSLNDTIWFGGTSFTGKAYQDELDIELGWDTSGTGTNGDLMILGEVRGLRSVTLDLMPSHLYFGRGTWANPMVAHFIVDSSQVVVSDLELLNGDQRLAFSGTVSTDPTKGLAFELEDVDLMNIAPLLTGPELRGKLSGDGRLFNLYDAPYLVSYVCADSLTVRNDLIGDVRFALSWQEGQRALDLNGTVTRGAIKALDFTGRMAIRGDNEIDLLLLMDRFDVAFVNPYIPEGISGIHGLVSGNVALTGTWAKPQLNGQVDLQDAGLTIDYLNTAYSFSSKVDIAPDMFSFDRATVLDEEGHTGRIGATVIHHDLKDWNYDVWGTLNNMMALNTTVDMNELYYGKAYATGDFSVSGYRGSLEINVDAATAPGTDIHLPVGGSTEVSPIGFVRFSSADTSDAEEEVDLSGVSLAMNVTVTPDARFELIFDPTVGDILSGSGSGHIEMGVTPAGEFSMQGQVQVDEGDYLFTLRNVVNKRFQIQPGGRITWYGDPFDAQLDIHALYKVRASLYDIVPPGERSDAYKKRVPVDVVMHLTDKLMNPEIGFQVRLPSVDESIKAQVTSALSTDQEMNRQVFALIVLNRFLQPPVYAGAGTPTTGGNVAGTTTSELLSNQVTNWLSGLSNDFDLGVNYRPGDNITKDEFEVAVSTQLLNERLLLSTNVGVQYGAQAAASSNTLVGDFQLEYLLTDDGKLRAKAFSTTNDRNLNQADQAPTTQGAGVAYRQDFDTVGELWQKVLNLFRSDANDRVYD